MTSERSPRSVARKNVWTHLAGRLIAALIPPEIRCSDQTPAVITDDWKHGSALIPHAETALRLTKISFGVRIKANQER